MTGKLQEVLTMAVAVVFVGIILQCHEIAAAEAPAGDTPVATIPIAREHQLLIVELEALGRRMRFLVDTAATGATFSRRYEKLLGSPTDTVQARDAAGKAGTVKIYKAPEIRSASFSLDVRQVAAFDFDIEAALGTSIDGCISFSNLSRHVVRFDFDRDVIELFRTVPADSGEPIELAPNDDGFPAVRLAIGNEEPRTFMLATAAVGSLKLLPRHCLFLSSQGAVWLPDRMSRICARDGQSEVLGLASSTRLGPFVHERLPVETWTMNALGLNYLERYVVTIDSKNQIAYFKKSRNFDRLENSDRSGLHLTYRDKHFVVRRVSPFSPADDCGLLEEDVLTRVAGRPADHLTLFQVRRILEDEGRDVVIEWLRDQRPFAKRIKLKDYRNLTWPRERKASAVSDSAQPDKEAVVLAEFEIGRNGAPLVVPVEAEGLDRPLLMLLDTGASSTTVDARLRPRLGKSLPSKSTSTPSGDVKLDRVRLNATKLGQVRLADETIAFLSDLSRWREETDYDVHGIIGMDLLHRQVIEMDYDGGKLRLLSRVPEDPGEKIAFDYLRSGLPVVGVTIGTLSEDLFTIDTGCLPNGFVDKSLFARLQRQHELSNVEASFHNDSAPWTSTAARFPGLQLGPFEHESLKMPSAVGSALGNRYLSRYRAVFDFPGRAIYLKKGNRYSEPDRDDASGLAVIRQNGELVVDSVDPLSCASQAGIRKGDTIWRIENEDVKKMSLFQLREVFKEAGRALKVVARRDNREIESVLHLKDYVAERLARKAIAPE